MATSNYILKQQVIQISDPITTANQATLATWCKGTVATGGGVKLPSGVIAKLGERIGLQTEMKEFFRITDAEMNRLYRRI